MLKRLVAIAVLVALCGCLLAACEENKEITAFEAKKIVLNDLGVTEDQVTLDIHNGRKGEEKCYFIYVTYEGEQLKYVIAVSTGEILSKGPGTHSH